MLMVEADRWKKQGATVIVLVDDAKRAQKVEQAGIWNQEDFKRDGIEAQQLQIISARCTMDLSCQKINLPF